MAMCAATAVIAIAVPAYEYSNRENAIFWSTQRTMNGAAWAWQGLVASGVHPVEATEEVSTALHEYVVKSRSKKVDIPFVPAPEMTALHDSFRLNPFIRSNVPRTSDPGEHQELVDAGRRVAVLISAVQRRETERVNAELRKHALLGVIIAAASVAVAEVIRRRRLRAISGNGALLPAP